MNAGSWMRSNLSTQGYCLTDAERRELSIGLRFSTGLCLSLVSLALVLESATFLFVMVAIGAAASFTSRHPFDYLWNHGLRRLFGGPQVPPSPTRRRQAFMVATVWLLLVGTLFVLGVTTAALVLGFTLVAACAVVTATNLCLPSETFAWIERRRGRKRAITL
jgi:hypothetical protein